MNMKILITGANGLLGSNLCTMYSMQNEVYATDIIKPDLPKCQNYKLDILDKKDLLLVEKIKPDLIVHCAALVNVDFCEEHPEDADKINHIGARNIAEVSKKAGSYLIHISTDSIFDGRSGNYKEDDKPNPINAYAKTKLEAENAVQKTGGNYAITRTNIYGWNRQNKESLAEWMLHKLERKEELPAVNDVYFSPILVNNLGEVILELYSLKYKGILHVCGSESCSKLDFAKRLCNVFKLDSKLIKPISKNSLNFKAKRPDNMSLNCSKAKGLLKTRLLNVEEGLKRFKELRENGFMEELRRK
jgi:dTDP-4-dehydrorhamnose reductase